MTRSCKWAVAADVRVGLTQWNSFFVAGHDTTSNSLACAMYYLAKHPEKQSKARAEVERIMGAHGDVNRIPTTEEQKQMDYLTVIVYESLR